MKLDVCQKCHHTTPFRDERCKESTCPLLSKSSEQPRAPGAIDQRDGFGMCAAPLSSVEPDIKAHQERFERKVEATLAALPSEKQGETPRTDDAEAEYHRWQEYAKQYGHLPEAMEQAPEEADPFWIARQLERALVDTKRRFAEHRKLNAALGSLPSATAANELLFRCHLAFNLGRAIDRSRLCRDIADYVVPLYKDRCG
jgi:hypothetical protein